MSGSFGWPIPTHEEVPDVPVDLEEALDGVAASLTARQQQVDAELTARMTQTQADARYSKVGHTHGADHTHPQYQTKVGWGPSLPATGSDGDVFFVVG